MRGIPVIALGEAQWDVLAEERFWLIAHLPWRLRDDEHWRRIHINVSGGVNRVFIMYIAPTAKYGKIDLEPFRRRMKLFQIKKGLSLTVDLGLGRACIPHPNAATADARSHRASFSLSARSFQSHQRPVAFRPPVPSAARAS